MFIYKYTENGAREGKMLKIPVLCKNAQKLWWICISLILAYLCYTAAYIYLFSYDPLMPYYAEDMLHSAFISLVIALGGALLFDLEMRFCGKEL